MKSMMRKSFLSIVVTVVLMSVFVGCGMEEINSTWCDRKVVIDGIDGGREWESARHSLAKGDVTIGIMNDEEALYVRLSTRNRAIRKQLLTTGFTVWFDETGGNNRMYGLRFPLPAWMEDPGPERLHPPSRNHEGQNDPPGISDYLRRASQGDMEIVQPWKNEFSSIAAEYSASYGIQCRLGNMRGNFIYELRIPMIRNSSRPYGIAMRKTKTMGIGFETGELAERQAFTGGWDGGGRGPGGGGAGGPGGGPGGAGGGRDGQPDGMGRGPEGGPNGMGDAQEMMKPIKLWLKVNLAVKP
ncbi:MAG: hypothetical protein PHN75_03040 [Syntrophales bacterium]|nr:hypothetical protein [Syntrophales bacterium]